MTVDPTYIATEMQADPYIAVDTQASQLKETNLVTLLASAETSMTMLIPSLTTAHSSTLKRTREGTKRANCDVFHDN